jgi:hypothetical protein
VTETDGRKDERVGADLEESLDQERSEAASERHAAAPEDVRRDRKAGHVA